MKKIALLSAAAFTVAAFAPAAASAQTAPAGPRAEVIVGWDHANGDGFDDDGIVYGLGIGYDLPVSSRSSLGVDAEISDSSAKRTVALGGGIDATYKAKRDLYVGARYSYAVADDLSLFATAGYTNQRLHAETSLGQSDSANLDGVRLGLGAQYDLSDNLYWTSSYRYSNYEAGFDRHQVVTGIGYRF